MFVMLAGVRMSGTIVIGNPLAPFMEPQSLRKSDLILLTVTIEDYGRLEDYRQVLKPIFDAVCPW